MGFKRRSIVARSLDIRDILARAVLNVGETESCLVIQIGDLDVYKRQL